MQKPCFDVAHLGHVEIYTDKFDESLDFYTRIYGLTESGRDKNSAYLRAFDDYEFCTLKLTRHATTGVGHIAYRAAPLRRLSAGLRLSKRLRTRPMGGAMAIKAMALHSNLRIRLAMSSNFTGTQ